MPLFRTFGLFPSARSVVAPEFAGACDVALLAPLGSTGQQNDQRFTIYSKIHSIAWTPINPIFQDAVPYRLGVGGVALFYPRDAGRDLGSGREIKSFKPLFERTRLVIPDTIPYLEIPYLEHPL
jgi:hypothetical protein